MKESEVTAFRLSVAHEWAQKHAKKSERPSVFLQRYEEGLKSAQNIDPHNTSIDYTDPIRVAAEIEALATRRRVEDWYAHKGMCVSRRT